MLAWPGWCTSLGSGLLHTSVVVSDILWSFSDNTWTTHFHLSPNHCLAFHNTAWILVVSSCVSQFSITSWESFQQSSRGCPLRLCLCVSHIVSYGTGRYWKPEATELKNSRISIFDEKLQKWRKNQTSHRDFGICCSKVGLAGERAEKRDWKGRMVILGSKRWYEKSLENARAKTSGIFSSSSSCFAVSTSSLWEGSAPLCLFLVACCGSKGSQFGTSRGYFVDRQS